ncbi:thrombospondin type 3 repeat-containing protein [Moheibacter lacus]|uniref:Thrombospondin type 3 repeat-containing protein n=1 Tax=Moheibacter lacus TaxID=2745851 RepID=A0A838ZT95_9FLAO|nr:thrombospondin type 3 repeat-containing protein [Moheibacter lacus]MBA5630207.1 thrombospondin type 3 repeat-containing protein [Moheibacter lacus]
MNKTIFLLSIFMLCQISCSKQQATLAKNDVDTDLDGVHDRRDACPNESGSVFNLGCPLETNQLLSAYYDQMKSTDADLDGVADDKDECPDVYGSPFNLGCPFMMEKAVK